MRAAERGLLTLAAVILLAAGATAARGDTVYLRNGSTIDGVVLGKHEGHVILQIGNLGKMEIPEKDVLTIEKNARTGPINPERSEKRVDKGNPVEQRQKKRDGEQSGAGGEAGAEGEAEPIDPELEKEIQELVYDLTRDRATVRTRAEKRLTEIGEAVVPYVLPVATNPSELTRIAVFRILKQNPDLLAVDAALVGLEDSERFVRKLAWETLQEISGESWVYPWDDSATDSERQTAAAKWREWWSAEKARIEKEEAKKERRKGR
jgi:hypothetical protein